MFPGDWRNTAVIVRRMRKAIDSNNDRHIPIWVTEFGWPASEGRMDVPDWADTEYYRNFTTTDRGVASRLSGALKLLGEPRFRRRNGLERVYWYTAFSAFSSKDRIFDYSGLSRFDDGKLTRKPAYYAYRSVTRAQQGCTKDARGRCRSRR